MTTEEFDNAVGKALEKDDWEELARLVALAEEKLPSAMKDALRKAQAVSFAYGNLKACRNHGRELTREQVAEMYDAETGSGPVER